MDFLTRAVPLVPTCGLPELRAESAATGGGAVPKVPRLSKAAKPINGLVLVGGATGKGVDEGLPDEGLPKW